MPNRSKKRTLKQESPARSNGNSGPSEVDHQELKLSSNCSELSSNGDVQDPEHVDFRQEQVRKAVRNPLQNHDRMDSGRRYCLLTMIHEATN